MCKAIDGVFVSRPVVFAVGESYHIMAVAECEILFWADIGGKRYYDHSNGVLRSRRRAHRVIVPMSELDAHGGYTVCFRRVAERRAAFTKTGEAESLYFPFRPVPAESPVNIYQIADSHQKPALPQKAAQFFGESLHLLILNGDIFDFCDKEEDFDYLFRLAADVTHGEIPTVFAKGNHDNRGILAEKMEEYTPVRDGYSYYSFRLGRIWGLVLDCGENYDDDYSEYGNTVCHHDFRIEEASYIKRIIENRVSEYGAPGVSCRLIISHVAFTNVREKPMDIDIDLFREWTELIKTHIKPHLMLSGHLHFTAVSFPGDALDTLGQPCPVVIGANPVGWQTGILTDFIGTALTLDGDKARIRFTDTECRVKEEYVIALTAPKA